MTFLDHETSVEGGQPIEIYVFEIGTETFYYTSSEDTINYGGQSYVSRAIKRNSPKQSTEEGKARLEVTLPTDDPVCSRFIGVVPPYAMTVTLTRFHRADLLSGVILWSGRVIQAAYIKQGSQCKLTAVASESVFSRTIPNFKYQGLCNHKVYDAGCTLDPDDYKFTGSASSVTSNQITVNGLTASKGNGWATGGKATIGDDVRMVLLQDGDVLTLSLPFTEDVTGATVDVNAGCDHTKETCRNKFQVDDPTNGNQINYGGFPFVPTKNPFQVGVK